jgi:hypothetical protein
LLQIAALAHLEVVFHIVHPELERNTLRGDVVGSGRDHHALEPQNLEGIVPARRSGLEGESLAPVPFQDVIADLYHLVALDVLDREPALAHRLPGLL